MMNPESKADVDRLFGAAELILIKVVSGKIETSGPPPGSRNTYSMDECTAAMCLLLRLGLVEPIQKQGHGPGFSGINDPHTPAQ